MSLAIRILGLDPGLSAMGWGVIEVSGTRLGHVAHGVIATKPAAGLAYRLMALRGLPAAKALAPTLAEVEATLAGITARLEQRGASEAELLDDLISTAARIEHYLNHGDAHWTELKAPERTLRVDSKVLEKAEIGEKATGESVFKARLSSLLKVLQLPEAIAERLDGAKKPTTW